MAQASDDVPPAVVESFQSGGVAFREAVELNTSEAGKFSAESPSEVEKVISFGRARQSEYLTLTGKGPDYTTPADFYERGDYWLAIEYRNGEPISAMEVSSTGEFLTLDGWLPEEIEAIEAAPADAIIATDGRFEQAFAITDGGTIAHALNAATAEFIGGPSISLAELRGLKAAQLEEALEAEPDDVGRGAIGGTLGGGLEGAAPNTLWFWVSGGGLLLVGLGAYVLGRTRSKG